MSDDVFGTSYAAAYDALYRDKDYEAECDLIERILNEHGHDGPRRLLDLGCGTGNHALPLARRGHTVIGVDRSPSMLDQARIKARKADFPDGTPAPAFHPGDVRTLNLGVRFDAALMMFAVLGYQHENADLMNTLTTVRQHLTPGGLFVFDVWNGLAVLTDRPGQRIRTVKQNKTRIIRSTETQLDYLNQRCFVNFEVMHIEENKVVSEQREEHIMRFFFPKEIDLALTFAGMELIGLRDFSDYSKSVDEKSWNIIGIAKSK
ncbi:MULTISPECIES: class I SAM-dependent methyltransferase [unclassified Azospirillum]|uniref:class I SAM-dependent DNA methyltransferase n=1 Tax=unclassified Azospirillum TaxID=2630922 RepID=UPI000D6598EA|nr:MULTISPECIES: class I SAM-dependent methyltransferase [unclassified Azospirillum]